jgi:site-specific recombinase XerD
MSNEITQRNQQSMTRATNDQMLISGWIKLQRSDKTRETYAKAAAQFMEFINGAPLKSLTVDDLVDYRDHLLATYQASTARTKFNIVKSLLTFGAKTHYLPFNVGAAVVAPKANDSLHERILSEDEVQQIIDAATNERDRAIIELLYAIGGRVSEIIGITWGDIKTTRNGAAITVTGKGDAQRTVAVKKSTYETLLASKPEWATNDDPVFSSQKGGHLSRQQIWRIVTKAAGKAGIANVSPHWFRHSHVSHALDAGANPSLVQKSVGHKSLDTTGHYAHVKPDDGSALYIGR